MMKLQGWESRLNSVIEDYLEKPFVWGENDCLLFMADCILAISGVDIMADWRGSYDSEETAYAKLKEETGGSFLPAFSGMTSVGLPWAQRGDVGLMTIGERDYCGIVGLDARNFYLRNSDGGLLKYPLKSIECLQLWRIE